MKHGNYLDMQVKQLEQQIGKCKRTKKAINARNRQVSRNRSSDGVFIYSLVFKFIHCPLMFKEWYEGS